MKVLFLVFALLFLASMASHAYAYHTQDTIWTFIGAFLLTPVTLFLLIYWFTSFVLPVLWWLCRNRAEGRLATTEDKVCEWELQHSPPDSTTAIILIHGTNARDATWTTSKSNLAKTVNVHGDLVRFLWSGGNSMRTRRVAVEKLRDCISDLVQKGYTKVCLVGHSHGGNIALKACEEKTASEAVVAIVTLATPFIHKWRPQIRMVRGLNLRLAVFALTVLVAGVFLLAVLLMLISEFAQVVDEGELRTWVLRIGIAAVPVIAFAFWLSRKMPSPQVDEQMHEDIRGSVYDPDAVDGLVEKTLIMSHSGDEADGVLKIASAVNRILVNITNSDFDGKWRDLAADKAIIASDGSSAFVHKKLLRTIVFSQVRLIGAMANMAFGADGLASGTHIFLASSETPRGSWNHRQFTGEDLAASGHELYHSVLYEDPGALAGIEAWVRQRCACE